jgi:uncharacterized protein (TIGR02646 family)
MIFTRNPPPQKYKDYTRYRPSLRRDFKNRCAYCLTHEYFVGGEAGFEIDHYRPQNGMYARPDLVAEYTNLYWSCGECNSNKGEVWPSPEDESQGFCFIDPCIPEGDHEKHWIFNRDGSLKALTSAGEYTEEKLLLWRPFLQERRRQQFEDQEEERNISETLKHKHMDGERRAELEYRLAEIRKRLAPPVFARARRGDWPTPTSPRQPKSSPATDR